LRYLWLSPHTVVAQLGPPHDGPIDNNIRKEVISSLSSVLADGYYDLLKAKKMIAKIEKFHKEGKYDTIKSGRQFAI
jgi:NurA-like 5'-3' nuclease